MRAFENEILTEYQVVREGGAGLIDLSPGGRLVVEGSEAEQFLNGLITNDVKTLDQGAWMPAAFPTVQGRLLACARVLRFKKDRFLVDTELGTYAKVRGILERFTLAGDFHLKDVTAATALISLQGRGAMGVLARIAGSKAMSLEPYGLLETEWQGSCVTILRATHTGENGYDFIVAADCAPLLKEAMIEAGAKTVTEPAIETLRIEAGIPKFGVDMNENSVVLEVAPDEAVSFTKGCYIGQEIIARIHFRGHVARKLAGLRLDTAEPPGADSRINSAAGKEIGRVTSTTFSPGAASAVALAHVKYDHLQPGTEVRVATEDGSEITGRTSELPLVPVSWNYHRHRKSGK